MKLFRFLAFVGFTAALAPSSWAQGDDEAPFRHLDPEETITANFKDEDLTTVLDLFSSNYALNIVSGPNVSGKVTMNLYEAPVKQALEKILASNGYTYTVEGNFVLIQPVTQQQQGAVAGGPSPYEPRVIYLNHLKAKDVAPMIDPLLNFDEAIIAGPESSVGIENTNETGGNALASREMLVLLGSEATHEKIMSLLEGLDIPPPQVLVEATIMQVTLNNFNKMGVDFTALGGIDFQALGGVTTVTDELALGSASTLRGGGWDGGARTTGFTKPGDTGLHIGILRDQFGIFLDALETVGNATVISNPSVLAVNRHSAQVLVGKKIGYLTLQQSETSTVQTVEFLEVGTSLVFRPFISDDGYVRLEIKPKNSDGLVSATTGLPEESTTEVTTNVLVRSGHTIVIGGLMEKSLSTNISQVPFLGSLPIVGALFRSESQVEDKTEIIILLTPHIVGDSELSRRADEARRRFEASAAQLASSHYGYLRPSYARRLYTEALAALGEGDPALALAKCEWGLKAMPADPDLALLAAHCRDELRDIRQEDNELKDAIELLDRLNAESH